MTDHDTALRHQGCPEYLAVTGSDGEVLVYDECRLACALALNHPGEWHYDETDDVTWRKGRHLPEVPGGS